MARPIRVAKGAGGHAPALEVAEQAARHGVLRLVFAHKRTPTAARSLCTHSNKCMPIICTGTRCVLASPSGRGEPTSGPA